MTSELLPEAIGCEQLTEALRRSGVLGNEHLLLEDLTESHNIATAWPLPPTMEQCASIVQARARFHAEWWDNPRLGASVGAWSDAAATGSGLSPTDQVRALPAHGTTMGLLRIRTLNPDFLTRSFRGNDE